MNNTSEKLSAKKEVRAVSILRFMKFRGKLPNGRVLVVEGDEDPTFYSSIFNRLQVRNCEVFFIANGKENVLGLRDFMGKSKEAPKTGETYYFVDNDFDGLKGGAPGEDIYVTPTYSIENIVVSRVALRALLLSRFKLVDADTLGDVDQILLKFDALLKQHEMALAEANRLIHFVRNRSLAGDKYTSGSIDSNCSKFADVRPADLSVVQQAAGDELLKLIQVHKPIDATEFEKLKENFYALDSVTEWRGKFLFYLFRRFISVLVEDRNSTNPRFFSKGKGKISLDTSSISLIGTLASVCQIPDCLAEFMGKVDSASTQPQ